LQLQDVLQTAENGEDSPVHAAGAEHGVELRGAVQGRDREQAHGRGVQSQEGRGLAADRRRVQLAGLPPA